MTTATQLAPTKAAGQADDEILHIVCCDENLALCGADATTLTWSCDGLPCLVCHDLEKLPAECCGE